MVQKVDMANSKVDLFGETLIDLTHDTVTPEDLAVGVTAHAADGTVITGTHTDHTLTYDSVEEALIWA